MDIGQGACVYVDCPNPTAGLLVDCGSDKRSRRTPSANAGRWIDGKLQAKGFNSLVISHPHTDHFRILSGSIDPQHLNQVFLGGRRDQYRAAGGRGPYDAIDRWLQRAPQTHAYAAGAFIADGSVFRCAPATVNVLTASFAETPDAGPFEAWQNGDSVVLRISFAGQSVVLPGDAEGPTQLSALANARAGGLSLAGPTVMIASHHGSDRAGSNDAAWLDAWKPVAAVFSSELTYRHRHPRCGPVEAYAAFARTVGATFPISCGGPRANTQSPVASRILSTFDNGAVRIRLGPDGIRIACQVMTPACQEVLPASELPSS